MRTAPNAESAAAAATESGDDDGSLTMASTSVDARGDRWSSSPPMVSSTSAASRAGARRALGLAERARGRRLERTGRDARERAARERAEVARRGEPRGPAVGAFDADPHAAAIVVRARAHLRRDEVIAGRDLDARADAVEQRALVQRLARAEIGAVPHEPRRAGRREVHVHRRRRVEVEARRDVRARLAAGREQEPERRAARVGLERKIAPTHLFGAPVVLLRAIGPRPHARLGEVLRAVLHLALVVEERADDGEVAHEAGGRRAIELGGDPARVGRDVARAGADLGEQARRGAGRRLVHPEAQRRDAGEALGAAAARVLGGEGEVRVRGRRRPPRGRRGVRDARPKTCDEERDGRGDEPARSLDDDSAAAGLGHGPGIIGPPPLIWFAMRTPASTSAPTSSSVPFGRLTEIST